MKYLFVIILALLISCQSHTDIGHERKEIMSVLLRQQNSWNEGNIEAFMQGYLKSDSLRFASGGNVTYGWQTTLDRYLKGYPDKSIMGQLTFSEIDIKLISNTSALAFGKWELERGGDHPWGFFTLIFQRTPEGWRIVHDHTSSAKTD